eukprot:sb/3461200/
MYGKGGHFKKHKDTPRGSDMIGTLLVQLPGAYYEGGALKITAGDGSMKKKVLEGYKSISDQPYMWQYYIANSCQWQAPDPKELRIAAFFCDIDHETKCNTDVRDALQLPADKFEVKVNMGENAKSLDLGEALVTSGVLGEVQKNLEIDSERFDLVAEQYSLNMYGKGGHFRKHKDTPRGSDMIGTLLVQLPGAYYEGGALEISVGDGLKKKLVLEGHPSVSNRSYYWQQIKWQEPDPTKLRIAAFFCDIDHEVMKVEEGLRLTAAFILRIKEKIAAELSSSDLNSTVLPKSLSSSEKETTLAGKFMELCNDESFLPTNPLKIDVTNQRQRERGETRFDKRPAFLAFPCFHLYTNSQVFTKKNESAATPLTPTQVAMLKGKDAILGKAVLAASEETGGAVKIYLQPILGHEYTDDAGGSYLMPKFPTPKFKVPKRMSDDSIESKFKTTGCFEDIWPIWVVDEELGHKPDKIGGCEWNSDGYFGNEASYIDFYVKSFLRVEFAPSVDRKKMIQKARDQPKKVNRAPAPKRKAPRRANIATPTKPKKAKMNNPGHYVMSRGTSPGIEGKEMAEKNAPATQTPGKGISKYFATAPLTPVANGQSKTARPKRSSVRAVYKPSDTDSSSESEKENNFYLSMSTGEEAEEYATEKGKELATTLAGVSCEFSTTANLTVTEAPMLLFKGGDDPDFPSVMLEPNSVVIDEYIREALEKQVKEKEKCELERRLWSYKEKPETLIRRDAVLSEQIDRFERLREAMPQASFGHGSETKCDTGVRDALQLPADKFEVKVNIIENSSTLDLGDALATSGVLEEVQRNLGIDSERFDLVAEQYSLNMYGKGGHFKKHKDTPRGSDMVGTLLVQLPGAYYEGGALEISVGDGLKKNVVLEGHKSISDQPYMWQYYIANSCQWQAPDPKELRIAAFFCDIDHEVMKVLEGLRLTVAFILRIKEKSALDIELSLPNLNCTVLPKTLSSSEKETSLARKFVELCNDESFLPVNPVIIDESSRWERERGETRFEERPIFLAFPCFHLYTNSQVFTKKNESAKLPLTSAQVAMLKGKDAILGKAVLSASEETGGAIKIYLQPILGHDYTDDAGGSYLMPKFPTPKFKVPRRMSDDTIESKFKTTGCFEDIWPIWVVDEELGHKPDKIGGCEWNHEGYFGNEASDIDFYVKSFLRVEFGPSAERKKMIQKARSRPSKENRAPAPKRKANIAAATKPKKAKMDNPGHYIMSRGTSP